MNKADEKPNHCFIIRYTQRGDHEGAVPFTADLGPFKWRYHEDTEEALRELRARPDVISADVLEVWEWHQRQADDIRADRERRPQHQYWVRAGGFKFHPEFLEDEFVATKTLGPYATLEEAQSVRSIACQLGFLSEIYEYVDRGKE